MFCENCGKKIQDDDQYCIWCGSKQIHSLSTSQQSLLLKQREEAKAEKLLDTIDENLENLGDGMSRSNRIISIIRSVLMMIILFIPWIEIDFGIERAYSVLEISDILDVLGDVLSVFDESGDFLQFFSGLISVAVIINIILLIISIIGVFLKQYWYEKAEDCANEIFSFLCIGIWIGKGLLNHYVAKESMGEIEKLFFFTGEFKFLLILAIVVSLEPIIGSIRKMIKACRTYRD